MNTLAMLLVLLLGSERFADRERAEDYLSAHECFLPWVEAGLRFDDTEVRHRCGRIIEVYRGRHVETTRNLLFRMLGSLPRPLWLESLPEDYPQRDEILTHYRSIAEGDADYDTIHDGGWYNEQNACRLFLHDLVNQDVSRSELVKLVETMSARGEYYRDHRSFPEEILVPPR